MQADVLLTGGEDANFFAWSCAPLPKEENDTTIDGSFSPSLLAKRNHDGDVEMSSPSPTNVCRRFLYHATPGLTCQHAQKKFRYL